jgi:peptide/nickel transport system permease protein
MLTYTLRRLLTAIPTLIFIALVIFLVLELAPGDPLADQPLTLTQEDREAMRQAMGLDQPAPVRFALWLKQFFVTEPCYLWGHMTGAEAEATKSACGQRIVSWQFRGAPVMDIILQRVPQTLWVVGLAYLIGVLIAVPVGIISAVRQYSVTDQVGNFVSMVGFSFPTFFTGNLLIVIFAVELGWLPSIYNTQLEVTDWPSFWEQVRQMIMPVAVLALFNASQISRYMRAAMLDNLTQDYVRTARAKGMTENVVVLRHVLRNSMIPVVTVIALGIPTIFGGAIITEQVFKVNGLGQLLIVAIQSSDLPMVQTLTFLFAVLIVLFNLIADVLYGILDPRIRYD